jgi:GT2 family glycosyltransferase
MKPGQGRPSLAFLLDRVRRHWRAEAVINRRYPAWLKHQPAPDPRAWARPDAPGISIVMPVHDPRPEWLRDAIASVLAQSSPGWELLIADDASRSVEIRDILNDAAAADPRIRVVTLARNGGISAASNAALACATLPAVTFLDHDDCLAPHAVARMAWELAAYPDCALAFSDEDQLIGGTRAAPYFKPGWNPDLLLSQNLICHVAVYRRDLVMALGGLRPEYDGSQDWDLALRAVQLAGATRVRHVPEILYHWRQSDGAFSRAHAQSCAEAGRRALRSVLVGAYRVELDPGMAQWPRVTAILPEPAPRVSVIGAALPASTYPACRVSAAAEAALATGDVLLFLSPALAPASADWLEHLVARAMQDTVGAAGARLDTPGGRLSHAGFCLGGAAVVQSLAAQADHVDPGYRGLFRLARTVTAVSGDCLAVRRAIFEQAGGWNPEAGDFAAVDLCLRLARLGYRTVWEPAARLRYATRPVPLRQGAAWMRARWGAALDADPYGNPHLRVRAGRLSLA